MATTTRFSGKTMSVPGGLAIGAAAGMVTTAAFSGAIAFYLNCEKISWSQAGYWIMGMLFLASFIGAKAAYGAIKRQRLAVSMLSGLLYWGLLLGLTALFFGGDYEAIGVTGALIGAGTGTAALISGQNRRISGRNRKTRIVKLNKKTR